LNNKFDRGMIICSQITANLLHTGLGIPLQYIRALPMRQPTEIDSGRPDGSKCSVTLIDANHCPGAVCFLFKLPSGRVHLHTGDFRYDAEHPDHKMLASLPQIIDNVYLDTTYCNQNYNFPPQRAVVSRTMELMSPFVSDSRTLIVVGAYTIGKERIFLQAAEQFHLRVFCSPYKYKILSCLCLEQKILSLLTKEDASARIHVVPIGTINMKGMEKYLRDRPLWRRVVAFKPTGWTYEAGRDGADSNQNLQDGLPLEFDTRKKDLGNGLELVVVNVPYSEHSSFGELRQFVRQVKSRMLIPTVNNYNGSKVKEMLQLLRQQANPHESQSPQL
jgi:DNA cross-link repair 1A protein